MRFADDGLDRERQALLIAALPLVPRDGWSVRTLKAAAKVAGLDCALAAIMFPQGAADLLHFWSQQLDMAMLETLAARDLTDMKVREKVTFAVRSRIELMTSNKEAAYRAFAFLALPSNAGLAAKLLYGTVDAVWHGIGDRSTDWNFYSKRAILAAVFSSTILYWLGDESSEAAATWVFLGHRIDDVMTFEKTKARMREWVATMPSPFSAFDTLFARTR